LIFLEAYFCLMQICVYFNWFFLLLYMFETYKSKVKHNISLTEIYFIRAKTFYDMLIFFERAKYFLSSKNISTRAKMY
jgi:hypothetical protein